MNFELVLTYCILLSNTMTSALNEQSGNKQSGIQPSQNCATVTTKQP